MDLIHRGGFVMWPLLALSIMALAIIVERFMAYSMVRLGDQGLENRLLDAVARDDEASALDQADKDAPVLKPLIRAVLGSGSEANREREAAVAVEDTQRVLEKRLGFLSVTARLAPLLGLLGTVLGMIRTFSGMASTQGAMDMTALADGIWQALLTTAFGLIIAAPVVLAHQAFLQRQARVASLMARLANLMMARRGGSGSTSP